MSARLLLLILLRLPLALFLLAPTHHASAASQSTPTPNSETTYIYFQRTSHHVKLGTQDVFDQVVSEFREYLTSNRVVVLTENNVLALGAELPLSAVQEMARDSGSAYLMYVLVDRPMSKWLKVTVRCYDSSGRTIWQEEASAGSGFSPKNVARDALQKLRVKLNPRLGQPGLPQATAEQTALAASNSVQHSAQAAPTSNEHQGAPSPDAPPSSASEPTNSQPNIHLANGTPVRLLLAEPVSSKSAQQGGTVKLQVLGDVKVGDLVVIANKAPATATIQTASAAGRAWRKGTLLLKLGNVTLLNQQQQPLRAWGAAAGRPTGAAEDWASAIAQTYGLALFFLPFAPLQHGNDAILPRGALLEAAISGDAQLSPADFASVQPTPPDPRRGPASVTFYYQDLGEGNSVTVWCGRLKLGLLRRGGKFTATLPPGKYWLRPWDSKRSPIAELDVEDGGEYYVSVVATSHPSGSNTNWLQHFVVVPHDAGELASSDTSTSKCKNVQDPARLDLAQLQSDPRSKKPK